MLIDMINGGSVRLGCENIYRVSNHQMKDAQNMSRTAACGWVTPYFGVTELCVVSGVCNVDHRRGLGYGHTGDFMDDLDRVRRHAGRYRDPGADAR